MLDPYKLIQPIEGGVGLPFNKMIRFGFGCLTHLISRLSLGWQIFDLPSIWPDSSAALYPIFLSSFVTVCPCSQVVSAAILVAVLGMTLAWRPVVSIMALQPIITGSCHARRVLMKNMSWEVSKILEKICWLACEAVVNHKITTAFSFQEKDQGIIWHHPEGPQKECRKTFMACRFGSPQFMLILALSYGMEDFSCILGRIAHKYLLQTSFILVTTGRVIAGGGIMTSELLKGTDAVK